MVQTCAAGICIKEMSAVALCKCKCGRACSIDIIDEMYLASVKSRQPERSIMFDHCVVAHRGLSWTSWTVTVNMLVSEQLECFCFVAKAHLPVRSQSHRDLISLHSAVASHHVGNVPRHCSQHRMHCWATGAARSCSGHRVSVLHRLDG